MICLFHRTDFDGKCAGAIVKYRFPECKLYGIDYADIFDLEKIEPNEEVIMVDFTLEKPGDMISLAKKCSTFTWIDHHDTCASIEEQIKAEDGLLVPLGIRQISKNAYDPEGSIPDNRISACELTWKFFFPERRLPYAVWLLGRYDVWNNNHPRWESEILPFQYGMRLNSAHPADQDFWEPYFKTDETCLLIIDTLIAGRAALKYDEQLSERIAKGMWFPIEFDGLKFQAINRSHANSHAAKSIWNPEEFDGIMYFCKGKSTWRITMFTDKEGVNLFPTAKKYGGGGHKQACGFTTNKIMETIPQLIEF
jgi:hypothetical protein